MPVPAVSIPLPDTAREDYEVCLQYGIDIYSPLNDRGEYLDSVEFFAGLQVQKANPNVIEKVKEVGNLMGQADITHSYPHCWRCKKPVIFRATTQWFVSMEANELRQKALKPSATTWNGFRAGARNASTT